MGGGWGREGIQEFFSNVKDIVEKLTIIERSQHHHKHIIKIIKLNDVTRRGKNK